MPACEQTQGQQKKSAGLCIMGSTKGLLLYNPMSGCPGAAQPLAKVQFWPCSTDALPLQEVGQLQNRVVDDVTEPCGTPSGAA